MITTIQGIITYHGKSFVIIESHSIGYKVILPEENTLGFSGEIVFYTHEVMRDSEKELFGFLSMSALEMFWKLISISGVGPRSAQKIVYSDKIEKVRERISSGDLAFLTAVQGIGKKTGQKIILELKGTIVEDEVTSSLDNDAVDALIGLGYRRSEAEEAVAMVEVVGTEECIREALKMLSKR